MCICLNCVRIVNCHIYSIIAEKHKEQFDFNSDHLSVFFPQSPIILTILYPSLKKNFLLEWDVNDCLSYQEQPGSWITTAARSFTRNSSRQNFSYLIYDGLFEVKNNQVR